MPAPQPVHARAPSHGGVQVMDKAALPSLTFFSMAPVILLVGG